jgi:hypothetical protein
VEVLAAGGKVSGYMGVKSAMAYKVPAAPSIAKYGVHAQ